MAPALPRLGCWCIQVPRGYHPRKSCPASAVARSSRPAPSPATHCVPQAVLGRIAKVLGSMEGTSDPGDTQNRCRLASCRFSAVLEMAFTSQDSTPTCRPPRKTLFLSVDRVNGKLDCRPYRGGEEGNPRRLVEAASLAFSNRSNILTIRDLILAKDTILEPSCGGEPDTQFRMPVAADRRISVTA